MGKPFGFGSDARVFGAKESTLALSANYESQTIGVMAGGYFRRFSDANKPKTVAFSERRRGAASDDLLYQVHPHRRRAVVSSAATDNGGSGQRTLPKTDGCPRQLVPIVAPLGRGTYSRPFLYGIYTLLAQQRRAVLPVRAAGCSRRPLACCTTWGSAWSGGLTAATASVLATQGFDDETGSGGPGKLLLSGDQQTVAHGKVPEALIDDEVRSGNLPRFGLNPKWLDAATDEAVGVFFFAVRKAGPGLAFDEKLAI